MHGRPVYADAWLIVDEMPPLQELRLAGEINEHNVVAVTTAVLAAQGAGPDLLLDLTAAEFADERGIDALLNVASSLPTGRLVLRGLPPLIESAIKAIADGRAGKLEILFNQERFG